LVTAAALCALAGEFFPAGTVVGLGAGVAECYTFHTSRTLRFTCPLVTTRGIFHALRRLFWVGGEKSLEFGSRDEDASTYPDDPDVSFFLKPKRALVANPQPLGEFLRAERVSRYFFHWVPCTVSVGSRFRSFSVSVRLSLT